MQDKQLGKVGTLKAIPLLCRPLNIDVIKRDTDIDIRKLGHWPVANHRPQFNHVFCYLSLNTEVSKCRLPIHAGVILQSRGASNGSTCFLELCRLFERALHLVLYVLQR